MGAIQYLNSYYMNQHLQQEEDFLSKCMSHLSAAAEGLRPTPAIEAKGSSEGEERSDGEKSSAENPTKPLVCPNSMECSSEEGSLQCIQRALLLLKTHLDTFKRRCVYVLSFTSHCIFTNAYNYFWIVIIDMHIMLDDGLSRELPFADQASKDLHYESLYNLEV